MRSCLTHWCLLCTTLFLNGCAHPPSSPAPERIVASDPQTTETVAVGAIIEAAVATHANTERPTLETDRTLPRSLTISLDAQQFTYQVGGETVRVGSLSSGTEGHQTPTGHFSVLGKERDKVSSRYTNQLGMQAWMPYAIRFHGNYFLHEGWLPGYPDSHGCVRLGEQDARFLFEQMQPGDPVTVIH